MSKFIFIFGASCSGKSTFYNKYLKQYDDFYYLNVDNYVEDKTGPFYNKLAAASSQVKKIDLPNNIKLQHNIIYDTQGASINNIETLVDTLLLNNYEIFSVFLFSNPLTSIVKNINRERSLPINAILEQWLKLNNNIPLYPNIFKDFYCFRLIPSFRWDYDLRISIKYGELDKFIEGINDQFNIFDHTSSFSKSSYDAKKEFEKKVKWESLVSQLSFEYENIHNNFVKYGINEESVIYKLKQFIENE